MRRRLLVAAALLGAWLAVLAVYRKSSSRRRDRVDLYFEDGSMVSLGNGSGEAAQVLPLAREALRAARPL
jgi:hypothetical protein